MKLYIFIIIFALSSCANKYNEHFFRENPEFWNSQNLISGEFFKSDGQIESLPNKNTQTNLIKGIHNANKRIWIEIYTWTDAAKIIEPIIQAKKRWVDVRVVLEGNVFWTPRINAPIYRKLKDANIIVAYADNNRYTFTHAKFWIIDNMYSISTGNWTASFFTKNREYIYSNTDSSTLKFLEEIFQADISHMSYKDLSHIPSHIVISPLNARSKIEGLMNSTQKKLVIYIQTLDDEGMLNIIKKLYNEKKEIQICTADNDSNRKRILEFPLWKWKTIRKPYLHAKVIMIDDTRVFIGSHNLTTNAIENNREMGIILDQREDIVHQIENDFVRDGCR